MSFWRTLVSDAWSSYTPIVVIAFVIVRVVTSRAKGVERYHMRAATTLLFGHVVALVVAAGQETSGYDSSFADTVAFAFELLLVVNLSITAAFRVLLPRVGFVLPRILVDLITAFGVVIVFVAVGKKAGFSVAGLITTSAVLTAVIGFSLQDTLGNVMGGLSVQLDKSVKVGDWITLGPGQPVGRVTEIRWRYTAMETRNWETVIIPNGTLVKSQVMILGQRLGEPIMLRRHLEFFVDFRTAPTDVITAVEHALRADPVRNMAHEPPPMCLFFGVRDSFGVYAVRYWLTDLHVDDGTDSDVRVRAWYALRRAGIPLSIPASTVFLTHQNAEREQRKANEDMEERMAALASVDLFRGLPEAMRMQLATQLTYAPFAAGEAVTREGDKDDGLYMLVRGDAAVRIGVGREMREVATLRAGQFFGEMSLMTGEARTATVVAATDLVTYRVTKAAFQEILQATPAIADQIAEVLVQRKSELTAARDERDEVRRTRMQTAKQDLLGKIRGFFGINDGT
ncbi:MAG: mechanosensitive ion channel family protein [Deltaproteobacteria bacterium]|nr:mechanosensitive ion channel family protein [Deltaproteobacteria bacterium]